MAGSTEEIFDVLVIGGGINGAGIARDAAGRGFSVCLCEADDLASGTSSASSKLIHGGLRYLEHYKFGLVRKALKEREVLLRMAPHIIYPLRFILPYSKDMRARWLLQLGLFIYDHLGQRRLLPATRQVNLVAESVGAALKPEFRSGFEYSDCWVDDARLVVFNAMDAARKGAMINVNTRVQNAERKNGLWHVVTKQRSSGEMKTRRARIVVNAAGPWVDEVLESAFGVEDAQNVRLVRGSHIVVNKIFQHDKPYIFQNTDKRIIFAIPYEQDFTLIGTTDKDHGGSVNRVKIDEQECRYLCDSASKYFKRPILVDHILWHYSGVRPLFDDGAGKAQEATRDYVINTDSGSHHSGNQALLINIFGGKITTYRQLAETILEHVEAFLGKRGTPWTAQSPLPGGNFAVNAFTTLTRQLQSDYPFLNNREVNRLARSYGTLAQRIFGSTRSRSDMGQHFGEGLYQLEVEYLANHEWATTAHDILFRRTKLGITMPQAGVEKLDAFLRTRQQSKAPEN